MWHCPVVAAMALPDPKAKHKGGSSRKARKRQAWYAKSRKQFACPCMQMQNCNPRLSRPAGKAVMTHDKRTSEGAADHMPSNLQRNLEARTDAQMQRILITPCVRAFMDGLLPLNLIQLSIQELVFYFSRWRCDHREISGN